MSAIGKVFLDTNIFVYALDPSEPWKRSRSEQVITSMRSAATGVVSTQVMQELFSVATRKLRMPSPTAKGVVQRLGAFEVVQVSIDGRGPLPLLAETLAAPRPHSKGCGAPARGPASPRGRERHGWRGGRAASFAGSGESATGAFTAAGLSQPFAPTLPAMQTARLPRPDMIEKAMDCVALYAISFWDALIVAAAAAGCGVLYTEDLSAGSELLGVRVENPLSA